MPPQYDFRNKSRLASGRLGMVSADSSRCSDIGTDVLAAGGNAVDAAVATTLCQGVVNPVSSGIGGGAFIMIRWANGSAEFINARETAPAAANATMYDGKGVCLRLPATPAQGCNRQCCVCLSSSVWLSVIAASLCKGHVQRRVHCHLGHLTDSKYHYADAGKGTMASIDGGLSVAVPLELQGLYVAWSRWGTLPWAQLVTPAEQLAREGFGAHPYLVYAMTGPFTLQRLQVGDLAL